MSFLAAGLKKRGLTLRIEAISVFAAVVIVVFGTWFAPSANAQVAVKAKDLIGYAVDEVDARHEDVDRAIEAFSRRDVDTARQLLEQARRKDPRLPPSDLTVGKLYLMANQGNAARASFEKVVQDYPNDPEPLLIFGEQAVLGGRVTDAELLFVKGGQLTADYQENSKRRESFVIRSHVGMATVAEQRADWELAKKHLVAWKEQDPDAVKAYHRLGRAEFELANARAAYDAFMKASEIDKELPSSDVIIARLYEEKNDRGNSQRFMDRARQDPNANLQTKLAVVRWLMETEQYTEASKMLEKMVSKDPKSLDTLLFMGVVANILQDDAAAEKYLQQAYLISPQNFDAANQLALFLIAQPEPEKRNLALQYAQTNYQLHNNNTEAAITLGWIYYQLGQTQKAEQLLNAALKSGRLSADSSYFVAQIFYDRGRNEPAVTLLQQALQSKRVFIHRNEAKELLNKMERVPGLGGKP